MIVGDVGKKPISVAVPYPWTCTHCGQATTITAQDIWIKRERVTLTRWNPDEKKQIRQPWVILEFVKCPSLQCSRFQVSLVIAQADLDGLGNPEVGIIEHKWRLIPESEARPQPEYIPAAIREDYFEACRIRDLSPKASATLSRRCLQGMIRDFHGVTNKPNLKQEIEAIKEIVDGDVWAAIDAVREIGNVGAHMEKDVNLIVDVEPGEAQALIELNEMLFEEWYVRREDRKRRTAGIKAMAEEKKAKKEALKAEKKEQIADQKKLPAPDEQGGSNDGGS